MRIIDSVDGGLRVTTVPDPLPLPHEVVIEVVAAGVNRADLLQVAGNYPSPPDWPAWPGLECAGIVRSVGAGVTGWREGDKVMALVGGGAYAQFVAVPEDLVLPMPEVLDWSKAGGFMEAACTVWSNLEAASAHEGQRILIHGGSGGIGTFAIQLARALGLTVLTTAGGAARVARCLELGAHVAIDHREEDFVDIATRHGGVDIIFDVVGAAYLARNIDALAPDGTLLVVGLQKGFQADLDLRAAMAKRARIVASTLRGRPNDQRARIVRSVQDNVVPLLGEGLTSVIHAEFPFDDAASAHESLRNGSALGKVILTP